MVTVTLTIRGIDAAVRVLRAIPESQAGVASTQQVRTWFDKKFAQPLAMPFSTCYNAGVVDKPLKGACQ